MYYITARNIILGYLSLTVSVTLHSYGHVTQGKMPRQVSHHNQTFINILKHVSGPVLQLNFVAQMKPISSQDAERLIQYLTSSLALHWKIVWALWLSWAKAALKAVIFCRPSNVSSHWSGSTSPSRRSKSTNALSNSFSNSSSHRKDSVAAMFANVCYLRGAVFISFRITTSALRYQKLIKCLFLYKFL